MGIDIITAEQFDAEVLRADGPVLVDFFATWCGPCRTLGSSLALAERDGIDPWRIVKVDCDADKPLARAHGVKAYPTIVAFVGGEEVARHVGVLSIKDVHRWLRAAAGEPEPAKRRLFSRR